MKDTQFERRIAAHAFIRSSPPITLASYTKMVEEQEERDRRVSQWLATAPDDEYLEELIRRAAPAWKNVDAEKWLRELRGYQTEEE